MSKIGYLLAVILLTTVNGVAQEINWVSLEEALALQKKEPRKIMMDVYTVWCGPCIMLDKNTFQNPDVAAYVNKNYYAVKFNAEGNSKVNYKGKTFTNPEFDPKRSKGRNTAHQFTRFLGVRAYPSIIFFDEEGNFITLIESYLTPRGLELPLKLYKTDKYKEITSKEEFDAYLKEFKPEFKMK